MKLSSNSFDDGQTIPSNYAFCVADPDDHVPHAGVCCALERTRPTEQAHVKDFVKEIQAHSDKTTEEIEAGWASANALKRLGEPEEFAASAAFLVSASAAYITGIAFPVDGGHVKHLM